MVNRGLNRDSVTGAIERPFNTFANRADTNQAAARSGSTLFAYENMIRYDPTLVDLTSKFFALC